jgi:hypothetical protein
VTDHAGANAYRLSQGYAHLSFNRGPADSLSRPDGFLPALVVLVILYLVQITDLTAVGA